MNNAQLELTLERQPLAPLRSNRAGRASRASRWWFARMREVVDRALDWEPAPPARPEQIWFAGAHRQVRLG